MPKYLIFPTQIGRRENISITVCQIASDTHAHTLPLPWFQVWTSSALRSAQASGSVSLWNKSIWPQSPVLRTSSGGGGKSGKQFYFSFQVSTTKTACACAYVYVCVRVWACDAIWHVVIEILSGEGRNDSGSKIKFTNMNVWHSLLTAWSVSRWFK